LPEPTTNEGILMPNFHDMNYRQVLRLMEDKKVNLKLSGTGRVEKQYPAPGAVIRFGKQAWVRFGS